MNVDIAYRLSKLRRERGYSQETLAEKLGVSRQAISKWERAESSPDTDNLISLAELYGMSLDGLLKGDEEDAGSPTAEDVGGSDATEAESGSAQASPSSGEASSTTGAWEKGGDRVDFNLRDGLHVQDKNGAEVHIGWTGIHVEDPESDSHVHIGPGGVDVRDGNSKGFQTDQAGGYTVNGQHHETWQDARHAVRKEHRHRRHLERFPYGALALIAFLGLGVFCDMWLQGLVILLSTGVWFSLAHMVDSFIDRKASRKRRESVTAFIGSGFLFAFLAFGFLAGAWHPAWVLILVGLAICGIVNACWQSEV